MVDNKGSVVASPLPSGVSDATASLIISADRVAGSVILFDAQDNIVWVNERQRALMPCTDYVGQTYSSLFWRALEKGMVGNPVAKDRPQLWLEFTNLERATKRLAQSVNRYAWGDMAVTHRRFDDGSSLQIRFPTNGADADSPERLLLNAAEARHEATVLRHALDNLDIGVAVVDQRCRPLHTNAALKQIISENLGLELNDRGQITPLHPADHQLWHSAVIMSAAGYAPTLMMIPSADEPPLLALSIFPGAHAGTIVLLAARLRSKFTDYDVSNISTAFGMPNDQAEVMARLANGQTLQEIASSHQAEVSGNVVSPFFNISGLRHALRRHQVAADNQARIAALVLNVAAITRYPMAQATSTVDEEENDQ